jgi:hypothetical protein
MDNQPFVSTIDQIFFKKLVEEGGAALLHHQ